MNPEVKGLWRADGFLCRVLYLKHEIVGSTSLFVDVLKKDSMPSVILPLMPRRDLAFTIEKVIKGRPLKDKEFPQWMLIGNLRSIVSIGVLNSAIQGVTLDNAILYGEVSDALSNFNTFPLLDGDDLSVSISTKR